MSRDELIAVLRDIQRCQAELPDVEVKAAHGGTPRHLHDSLSALANRDGGGTILFGVDEADGFRVCGVGDPHRLMTDMADLCTHMSPPIRPEFSLLTID